MPLLCLVRGTLPLTYVPARSAWAHLTSRTQPGPLIVTPQLMTPDY